MNNRWAWGMVPKQEGGATNQTKPNKGYPWKPCERQPPHPSLQGAWRKKGPRRGWKRDQRPPTFQAPFSQVQPNNKQRRYIPHLVPYYVWPNLKLMASKLGCCSAWQTKIEALTIWGHAGQPPVMPRRKVPNRAQPKRTRARPYEAWAKQPIHLWIMPSQWSCEDPDGSAKCY